MLSKIASSVLALSAIFTGAQASLDNRQVECVGEPIVVYVSTVAVAYPVYISTYIAANTIININGGVTININNAPTFLNTIVTATSTSVVTSTVTTTATDTATATATTTAVPGAPFVIAIVGNALKRQSSTQGYVGFSGSTANIVSLKSEAALFTLAGSELFALGSYVGLTSTELSTGYGPFEIFGARPFISAVWSAVLGGPVSFTNQAFTGGSAEFCIDADGNLFNEYTSAPPTGCTIVTLIAEAPGSSESSTTSASITGTTTLPDGEVTTYTSPATVTPTATTSGNYTFTPSGTATTFTGTDGSVITTTLPGSVVTVTAPGTNFTETTTATTTSFTSLPTVDAATPFVIEVQTTAAKAKRAQLFVKFVAGVASTTDSRLDASKFTTNDYSLFSTGSNCGLSNDDIATGYAPLKLFSGSPDVGKSFYITAEGVFQFTPTSNEGIALGLQATFCIADDGSLVSKYSAANQPPYTCADVSISISLDTTTPSTTSATTTTSASSTSSTSSSTTTSNVSDDLDVPDPTPAVKPRYSYKKKSVPAGPAKAGQLKNRRGGVLRSPYAPKA